MLPSTFGNAFEFKNIKICTLTPDSLISEGVVIMRLLKATELFVVLFSIKGCWKQPKLF